MSDENPHLNLLVVGFCGADESVDVELLQMISKRHSWVEWGILFRSDLEGSPRYPSSSWLEQLFLAKRESGDNMKLAAHLCQNRCLEVLEGDLNFASNLRASGFRRFQINATKSNGIILDQERVSIYAVNLVHAMNFMPDVEWIIQINDETEELYQLLRRHSPKNFSILYDSSCGRGVPLTVLPAPPESADIPFGYAGGIGPQNIRQILNSVAEVSGGRSVWIDMESSLRIKVVDSNQNVTDEFSLRKCYECIRVAQEFGLT